MEIVGWRIVGAREGVEGWEVEGEGESTTHILWEGLVRYFLGRVSGGEGSVELTYELWLRRA